MLNIQDKVDFNYLKYAKYNINGKIYPLLTDPSLPLFNSTKGWINHYDGWYFYIVPKEIIKLVNSTGKDLEIYWNGNQIDFPYNPSWKDKYFTKNKIYIQNRDDEDEIVTKKRVVYGNIYETVSYRLDVSNNKIESKGNTVISLWE